MKEVFVGVDFGGTRIKIGLIADDQILKVKNIEASSEVSFVQRLEDITKEVKELLNDTDWKVTGLGLAFPGIVNYHNNRILSKYVKYPGAEVLDLNDWAQSNFKAPMVIENDARAALIGEWKYGAGRGCNDLVLVGVDVYLQLVRERFRQRSSAPLMA